MIRKVDTKGDTYPDNTSLSMMLNAMNIDVGTRLRAIRQIHGLSQRELARRAGVTNGLVSLVEMNRVSPSVSSLKKLLDGIPMSLAEFFTGDFNQRTPVFYTADDLLEIGNDAASLRLVAAKRSGRQMTLLHERYAPGAATGDEMLVHKGEEGGVVVRGRIEVTVGTETRVLGPGEAYYFASNLPHRFRNPGREVCEIVSCSTPPTF
jgi:transcriptional regulator with XRE-family HTH domain